MEDSTQEHKSHTVITVKKSVAFIEVFEVPREKSVKLCRKAGSCQRNCWHIEKVDLLKLRRK